MHDILYCKTGRKETWIHNINNKMYHLELPNTNIIIPKPTYAYLSL